MADKCGAKNRRGKTCGNGRMANGRCKFHGGMSTGPKTYNAGGNALKHGIYSRYLTEEEFETLDSLKSGSIDDELRLMRIQLQRALRLQAENEGTLELEEHVKRKMVGPGARDEKRYRPRDYYAIIDRLTARIESLEKTRMGLHPEEPPDPASLDAARLTPGTPDETPPAHPIR